MVLAVPPGLSVTDVAEEYDSNLIRRIIEFLRGMERSSYVNYKDVIIGGDPDSAGRAPTLVLRSPDGNLWRVTIDDSGTLATTLIPFGSL